METYSWIKKLVYSTLFAAVVACSQSEKTTETVSQTSQQKLEPYTQEGVASYYSRALRGQLMANGEPYKPSKMIAAHRRLPLGTKVKVINPVNDSSVVVEITDRGPHVSRRIIDLSRAAASKLNFIKKGRTHVAIEVIEPAEGYALNDSTASR